MREIGIFTKLEFFFFVTWHRLIEKLNRSIELISVGLWR